mgnify:CR=1 FL=1
MERKTEILDLEGAHCASCAYAIEHLGRKVKGVAEISVDSASRQIRVTHEGDSAVLEKIIEIVERLGYRAGLRRGEAR